MRGSVADFTSYASYMNSAFSEQAVWAPEPELTLLSKEKYLPLR